MQEGNPDFRRYFRHQSVSVKPDVKNAKDETYYSGVCHCQCVVKHLCAIEHIDEDPWKACMDEHYPQTCGAGGLTGVWSMGVALVVTVFCGQWFWSLHL